MVFERSALPCDARSRGGILSQELSEDMRDITDCIDDRPCENISEDVLTVRDGVSLSKERLRRSAKAK